MTEPIQFPVFVRIKDCGDVLSFSSFILMSCKFERIGVENGEYEAWDSHGRPLRMFVKETPDWLGLEPADSPAPQQLLDAIRKFARIQQVEVADSCESAGDFLQTLEKVTSAIRRKRQNETLWEKLKRLG